MIYRSMLEDMLRMVQRLVVYPVSHFDSKASVGMQTKTEVFVPFGIEYDTDRALRPKKWQTRSEN